MTSHSIEHKSLPSDHKIRTLAVDTSLSCIVQAPAGSGKTTLLVDRYLHLLGKVNSPEEILAITFTKKAAREMRQRVLEAFYNKDDIASSAIDRDQKLNWQLELNPQRLKIQTIDSFIHGVVHRMPYLSQLSLEFVPLEDADSLYQEAVEATLQHIVNSPDGIGPEISRALGTLDNKHKIGMELISGMLSSRQHWIDAISEIATEQIDGSNSTFTESIVRARESYIESRLATLQASLDDSEWQSIAESCQFAAKQLKESFDDIHSLAGAKFFIKTFYTKDVSVRKTLTKSQGFPTNFPDEKDSAKSCLEQLSKYELSDLLKSIKLLPELIIHESNKAVINDYGVALLIAVRELARIFRDSQVVDFTEMAVGAQRALDSSDGPTELNLALDYKISHILVDEYQDTSVAQSRLLNSLMSGWQPNDGNTFFAVGDPMQSIYMFRHANMQNFLNAFTDGMVNRQLEPLILKENFRSSPVLVNWINTGFRKVFGEQSDPELGAVAYSASIPFQDFEGEVHFKVFLCEDMRDSRERLAVEAKELAKDLKEALKNAEPDDTFALLVNTRSHLDLFLDELRAQDIECRGVNIQQLSETPVIQDLYSIAKVLLDRTDNLHWYATLLSPLVGLSLDEIEAIHHQSVDTEQDVLTCCKNYQGSAETNKRLARLTRAFESAYAEDHRSLRSILQRLWYRLGGLYAYDDSQILENAYRFFAFVEADAENSVDFDSLDRWIESQYASETNEEARVEVMTVHTAKGLEWDYVFVPKLASSEREEREPLIHVQPSDDGVLFTVKRYDVPDEMHAALTNDLKSKLHNESKRKLYVALTRAKKGLFLYGNKSGSDLKVARTPKTFLDFLLAAEVYPEEIPVESEDSTDQAATARLWKRLPADFELTDGIELPVVKPSALVESVYQTNKNQDDPLGHVRQDANIAVGILLHQELHRMCKFGHLQPPNRQTTARWRNNLRNEGFSGREINQILETVTEQLQRVLEDEKGLWILDNRHTDSATECNFTLDTDEELTYSRIDRTFVDENNMRWIIDYKSSAVTTDFEDEVVRMVDEYRPQLNRYAEIFKSMEDRPIQTALYVTSVPRLALVDYFSKDID